MKYLLYIPLLLVLLLCNAIHAQIAPSIEWQKSLGGSGLDVPASIIQTSDGGYIVAGYSLSSDSEVSGNHGGNNYGDEWIVKFDSAGNLQWQKCLGGSLDDHANSIQQTTDGGFIIAGTSFSSDGNVSGNHGSFDCWIVKIDSAGSLLWQKSFGGFSGEEASSVQQTADGGFIFAGSSGSDDGDVTLNHPTAGGYPSSDMWIVKLDTGGTIEWQKSLGGSGDDWANSIQQTADGGFIVAGNSSSNDGDVFGNHGSEDYWIVKIDSVGSITWQKSLGGSVSESALSVQQTSEGGYVVSGTTYSSDGDISGNHGFGDGWIVKLNSAGNLIWQKCLGGGYTDYTSSAQQTADGGFIVAGTSSSIDGDVIGNHGNFDCWIVKLNSAGNLDWQKPLGGSSDEFGRAIHQTTDDGFIIASTSASNDGDATNWHTGYDYYYGDPLPDYWIVKLSTDISTGISSVPNNFISLSPNPVQTLLTLDLHSFSEGGINVAAPANQVTICVYDLQGKMVMLPTIFTNTQALINTEKLPDGFYTLQVINSKTGEVQVGNFVKGN